MHSQKIVFGMLHKSSYQIEVRRHRLLLSIELDTTVGSAEYVFVMVNVASRLAGRGFTFLLSNTQEGPRVHCWATARSWQGEDGRVLLLCRAGCSTGAVVETLGLKMRDLFSSGGQGGGEGDAVSDPPLTSPSCTLEAYAGVKDLPVDFWRTILANHPA